MEKNKTIVNALYGSATIIWASILIGSLIIGNTVYNSLDALELNVKGNTKTTNELSTSEKMALAKADGKVSNGAFAFPEKLEKYESPVSLTDVEFIKKGRPVKWDKKAKISWVEFSDLKCSFCQRQHNNKTYDTVKEGFKNSELNFVYMPFTIFDAPGAALTECVNKTAGEETFYKTITDLYQIKDSSYNVVLDIAESHGADREKVQECYTNLESVSSIVHTNQVAAEGFGIGGTPGNIILNNETGEYVFLSGAQPASVFKDEINKLLKK